MDNLILLLLIVVVFAIYWSFNPNLFNESSEEFTGKEVNKLPLSHNPRDYQHDLNNEIDKTQLVGLPNQMIPAWDVDFSKYGDFNGLNDGTDGNMGMGFNMCSKSCCSTQYPPPFGLQVDSLVCESKNKFVPSTYTCNNGWQDGGCLCMTKEQSLFLNNRGNNA